MNTQIRITLTDNCNHYAAQINNDLVVALGAPLSSRAFDSMKDLTTIKPQLLELKINSVCAISAINTDNRQTSLALVKALMNNNNNEDAFIILIDKETPTIPSNLAQELDFVHIEEMETPTSFVYVKLNNTVQCRILLDEFDRYKRSDENYMASPFRERIIDALDVYNADLIDKKYLNELISTVHALGQDKLVELEFIKNAFNNNLSIIEATELYFSQNDYSVTALKPLKGTPNDLKTEVAKLERPYITLSKQQFEMLDNGTSYYKLSGRKVASLYPSTAHGSHARFTLCPLNNTESEIILKANGL
jgi:hypothetical protein